MTNLFLAVGVFLFTHLLPAIRPLRTAVIGALGRRWYFALFSVVSLTATLAVLWAFLDAPYIEVWSYHPWTRWAVLLAMPVSCVLVVVGLTTANPYSLTLNTRPFDPARPGIVGRFRHPVIWGMMVWSTVHMLPNGDVASLTLFGLLTLLNASGPGTLEKRRKSALGDVAWNNLLTTTVAPPVAALLRQVGIVRIVGGLALYLVLLFLHGPVIGVSPLDG